MNLTGQPPRQKAPKLTQAEILAGKWRMARVAEMGCVICGARPVEIHHVICGRYSSERAPDTKTIPLCVNHHRIGPDAIHNGKESWVAKHGPDTDYLDQVDRELGSCS